MKLRSNAVRQNIPYFILFLPVLIYFFIFKYMPMGGLIIAFKDYSFVDGIFGSPWVGFKHFDTLFSNPQTFTIIRNTLMISLLSLITGFPFPIIMALLLNEVRNFAYKRSIQTIVYLPHFLSWIIISGIVIDIFGGNGVLNLWLENTFKYSFPFLYEQNSWLAIFLGSGIWKEAGWGAIIYLAALSGIDPSLYESASLDGANKWQKIRHITLPGIASTIVILFILSTGHIMEVGFDQIFTLQNSAVYDVSEVISTYTYKVGLLGMQFSLTTAMGFFESLVGLILLLIANAVARKFDRGLF